MTERTVFSGIVESQDKNPVALRVAGFTVTPKRDEGCEERRRECRASGGEVGRVAGHIAGTNTNLLLTL